MRKRKLSSNPLHGGERFEIRAGGWIPRTRDGRECRDRLPWGGITSERTCACVGRCRYDEEQRSA